MCLEHLLIVMRIQLVQQKKSTLSATAGREPNIAFCSNCQFNARMYLFVCFFFITCLHHIFVSFNWMSLNEHQEFNKSKQMKCMAESSLGFSSLFFQHYMWAMCSVRRQFFSLSAHFCICFRQIAIGVFCG